ncbi:hypothetical protein RRG08_056195 [Elysia crispata]|uniref:Uncharacterized protein n=1 Tax=Elysia crispata TaxID=231223 RepID=A0AAE1D731_9GAST|nr:hypothetical protein RRG08_056195 [Elysia crispata]
MTQTSLISAETSLMSVFSLGVLRRWRRPEGLTPIKLSDVWRMMIKINLGVKQPQIKTHQQTINICTGFLHCGQVNIISTASSITLNCFESAAGIKKGNATADLVIRKDTQAELHPITESWQSTLLHDRRNVPGPTPVSVTALLEELSHDSNRVTSLDPSTAVICL